MLSSCVAKGPQFVPVENPPEDKAVIILFMTPFKTIPGAFKKPEWAKAIQARFIITNAGRRIVKLIRAGYYPYYADPGEITLTSEPGWYAPELGIVNPETLTMNVEAGKVYYVENDYVTQTSRYGGHRISKITLIPIADEIEAQLKLSDCHLLPKAEAVSGGAE